MKSIEIKQKPLQGQQAEFAEQAMRGVWQGNDLAKSLGKKLGAGSVLF